MESAIRRWMRLLESSYEDAEAVFLGGDCGTFAYALHKRTGWKAMSSGNHVWLVKPDGNAVDIRGVHAAPTAHLSGDERLAAHAYRISERDVADRNNLQWANQIIGEHPSRFGIEEW